ncbi:hypothetical protein Bca101_080011 [Brassica carinata]
MQETQGNFFGDLPCKRTCHGKGRMTKMLNQNSSQLIGALSSLTNISYILHTHLISFHISSFLLWLFPLLQSLLSRIERVDGFIIISSIRNANHRSDDEPQSRDHESRSNIRSGNSKQKNQYYYKESNRIDNRLSE